MVEHLKEYAKEGKPYESKQMMVNFALDAILSSGFGIQADSFKNPDGVIRKQARFFPLELSLCNFGQIWG